MFESSVGGALFLHFFCYGICCGGAYEICKIFKLVFKNNIWITNAIKFVYYLLCGMIFCAFVIKICDGEIYAYTIFASILGLVLEQISIGFFFTKFYKLLYNMLTKLGGKFKKTKLAQKILR